MCVVGFVSSGQSLSLIWDGIIRTYDLTINGPYDSDRPPPTQIASRFNRVVLLWAELADQVLFMNVDVFKKEYESSPSTPWTNFLEIRSPPVFCNRPRDVSAALTWVYRNTCCLNVVDYSSQSLPEVVILPFDNVQTLVPLAGVLLEYPVTFVPPDSLSATSYFAGETLDFFEVILRSPASDPGTLYVGFSNKQPKPLNTSLSATVEFSSTSQAQRPRIIQAHLLRSYRAPSVARPLLIK